MLLSARHGRSKAGEYLRALLPAVTPDRFAVHRIASPYTKSLRPAPDRFAVRRIASPCAGSLH